jgi:hypothetical protein
VQAIRAISFKEGRHHTLEIKNLPYKAQKTFFRLDREFDANLVEQHKYKTKMTQDKIQQALLARLKTDRRTLFKQYICEE